jgi:minor histocompatibility antigen H13
VVVANVTTWVKNSDVPTGGPYPVGHPDNPEWVAKADAKTKSDNAENRFKWKGLQPNLHLLIMATLCVFIGCKHGLLVFTEPVATRQGVGPQVLQSEDAYWFPVLGSVVLFGLFFVLKYLGSWYIKTIITCWIVMICTFGVGKNLDQIVMVARAASMKPLFRIPYLEEDIRPLEVLGTAVGAGMAAIYITGDPKNWIVNNLFGCSFCLLGIRMISLSSIKVGAILLIGLFFYDVFWVFGSKSVFGSNVMVSVATGVEAPIKLLFPRDLGGCGFLRHSMLGLGDIVLPGIYIAFLAKWDAVKMGEKTSTSFVYLNSVMVSYVLSLMTTVSIMLFFNAAQPALLYIVPYVLTTTFFVALKRGEVKALWKFEIPDESEPETGKDSGSKDNGDKKDD